MKTNSRNITLAQLGLAVLLPVLIALAAVLWTNAAQVQTTADSNRAQVPCRGLPALTMVVDAATPGSNGTLAKRVASPSGRCSLSLAVTADPASASARAPGPGEPCTITAAPALWDNGVGVFPALRGDCALSKISVRVAINSAPPGAAGSGRGSRIAHAHSSLIVGNRAVPALWMEHRARGQWWYNESAVPLARASYGTHLDQFPDRDMQIGSAQEQTYRSDDGTRVQAHQDIGWHQREHDFEPDWLSTRVKVIMKPRGWYECEFDIWGDLIEHPGSVTLNNWECFD